MLTNLGQVFLVHAFSMTSLPNKRLPLELKYLSHSLFFLKEKRPSNRERNHETLLLQDASKNPITALIFFKLSTYHSCYLT